MTGGGGVASLESKVGYERWSSKETSIGAGADELDEASGSTLIVVVVVAQETQNAYLIKLLLNSNSKIRDDVD